MGVGGKSGGRVEIESGIRTGNGIEDVRERKLGSGTKKEEFTGFMFYMLPGNSFPRSALFLSQSSH
jgi:hypothetical protein